MPTERVFAQRALVLLGLRSRSQGHRHGHPETSARWIYPIAAGIQTLDGPGPRAGGSTSFWPSLRSGQCPDAARVPQVGEDLAISETRICSGSQSEHHFCWQEPCQRQVYEILTVCCAFGKSWEDSPLLSCGVFQQQGSGSFHKRGPGSCKESDDGSKGPNHDSCAVVI